MSSRRSVFLKYHRREKKKPLERAKRDWSGCGVPTTRTCVACRRASNANRYVEEKADRTKRARRDGQWNEIVMAKGNGPSRCDVCQPPLARFTPLPLSRCFQARGIIRSPTEAKAFGKSIVDRFWTRPPLDFTSRK